MRVPNEPKYINKNTQIAHEIEVNDLAKSAGKNTQNESQFKGEFLDNFEVKLLWVLAFLGPIGLIYPFIISIKKEFVSKERKDYYYCDISRAKAENIAIFSLIITIAYSLILYYYLQDMSAK